MIRLGLRQFRTQAWVALGLLVLIAVPLAWTRSHIANVYGAAAKAQAACVASNACRGSRIDLSTFDLLLTLSGTVLVVVPAVIGAFWGAPLVARELESGTHLLAWTQSVSRTRWLAVKLLLVGGASVAATGLLSLLVTWWSDPIDTSNMNRFGVGLFGERNITPLGYAAFAFALGVTAGMILRRTLPAMAATVVGFLGVRLAFTYLVRPHLLPPVRRTEPIDAVVQGFGSSNGGPSNLFVGAPNLPNAWIYSTRVIDRSGRALTSQVTAKTCPDLAAPPAGLSGGSGTNHPVPAPADFTNALHTCVTKLSANYHSLVTYQPAGRYWTFQWCETAIFFAAAVLLGWLCLYRIRSRGV